MAHEISFEIEKTTKLIMGVKSCNRKNCDAIMCDTHIQEVGYICYDCQYEFKDYIAKNNIQINTDKEILNQLIPFMETYAGRYIDGEPMTVTQFFNNHSE